MTSTPKSFFTTGENDIAYLSKNFERWFDLAGVEPKKAKLTSTVLPRSMNSKEILNELKPSELTLTDVAYAIQNILDKTDWAIFYVRDKENVLRAVYVYWRSGRGGWLVDADGVGDSGWWGVGYQVFSRNSFGRPDSSDTSVLDRLTALEEWRGRVEKILKI